MKKRGRVRERVCFVCGKAMRGRRKPGESTSMYFGPTRVFRCCGCVSFQEFDAAVRDEVFGVLPIAKEDTPC